MLVSNVNRQSYGRIPLSWWGEEEKKKQRKSTNNKHHVINTNINKYIEKINEVLYG